MVCVMRAILKKANIVDLIIYVANEILFYGRSRFIKKVINRYPDTHSNGVSMEERQSLKFFSIKVSSMVLAL